MTKRTARIVPLNVDLACTACLTSWRDVPEAFMYPWWSAHRAPRLLLVRPQFVGQGSRSLSQ